MHLTKEHILRQEKVLYLDKDESMHPPMFATRDICQTSIITYFSIILYSYIPWDSGISNICRNVKRFSDLPLLSFLSSATFLRKAYPVSHWWLMRRTRWSPHNTTSDSIGSIFLTRIVLRSELNSCQLEVIKFHLKNQTRALEIANLTRSLRLSITTGESLGEIRKCCWKGIKQISV